MHPGRRKKEATALNQEKKGIGTAESEDALDARTESKSKDTNNGIKQLGKYGYTSLHDAARDNAYRAVAAL